MKRAGSLLAIISGMSLLAACQSTGEGVAWDLVPDDGRVFTSASAASTQPAAQFRTNALCRPGVQGFVQAGTECLALETIAATNQSCPEKVGFLVIHGDGASATKGIMKAAQFLSGEVPCSTYFVIGMPGYKLPSGNQSSGYVWYRKKEGYDNATPHNMHATAMALRQLKKQNPEIKIWGYIGQSTGSNFAGWGLGTDPGMAMGGVLFSGTYNIPAWVSSNGLPKLTRSKSAIDVVAGIPDDSIIFAVTGEKDTNTNSSLTVEYIQAARNSGVTNAQVIKNSGGHRPQHNADLVSPIRKWITLTTKIYRQKAGLQSASSQ